MRFFFLYFIILGSFSIAKADSLGCKDLGILNEKWKSTYYHQLNILDDNLKDLKCNDSNYKIAQALFLLETFKPSNLEFNFYIDLVATSIKGILTKAFVDNTTWCALTKRETGVVTLGECFYSDDIYARAGFLVHESRHAKAEEATYHVECTQGKNEGTKNCDETFNNDWESASSYSLEVMFYKKLYDNASTYNFNKRSLKQLINGNLNAAFNQLDPTLKEAYYIH